MKEMINKSLEFWNNYWGGSLFPWLLAASVLYLLIFKHRKKTVRYVLAYVCVTLFLFFFPYTAKIIQKCVGESVYWRVLWIVPSAPGKKGLSAADPAGAFCRGDRLERKRILYRRLLS